MALGGRDRGKLLMAVLVRSLHWQALLWCLIGCYAALCITEWVRWGKSSALSFIGVIAPAVAYALYPRVRFFERGIDLPPTRDTQRHFLRWDQIQRYSWDGNTLVLTGTSSIFAGGPVEGGLVAIPPAKRRAVEELLSANAPRSAD